MKHYIFAIASWLWGYSIAIIVIAVLVWGYFTIAVPILIQTNRASKVVEVCNDFETWVESITDMETDYDKILREGKD